VENGRKFNEESKIGTSLALFSMMLTMKLEPSPPSSSIAAWFQLSVDFDFRATFNDTYKRDGYLSREVALLRYSVLLSSDGGRVQYVLRKINLKKLILSKNVFNIN
jgi:hypothetical protein